MMKEHIYTLKDFKISYAIALFFTILSLVGFSIVKMSEAVELSEAFVFPIGMATIYFMPVLLILSWYMCYERYVYLELQTVEEAERRKVRHQIYLNVLVLLFWGIITLFALVNVVNYISWYWEYIENLYGCIALLAVCAVGWFVCFMWYVQRGKDGCLKNKIYKKRTFYVLAVLLIVGTLICSAYAYNKGENEWFRELVEESNREFGIE